ncbi:MAG TPA: ComEC/Rec2 family competence protein [Candidatus Saccharimonadales bacterium]|nr:ComEC/Rec2 family competence protein [Candidatus Saccharimonadales bacterium]
MLIFLRAVFLKRSWLVGAACLAFFAGAGLAHGLLLGDTRWVLLAAPLMVFALYRRWAVAIVLVAAVFFGVGWWRGSGTMRQLQPYQQLSRQNVTVVGQAAADGVYGTRYQTTFTLDHMRILLPAPQPLPGTLSVAGFGAAAVYRGDTVQVSGKLYPTRGNSQGRISFGELQVLARNASPIDTFRRRFAAGMQSALPEPAASFGLGLLIGQRSTLPEDISQTLLVVGLTHIIAVSGYNLTIIVNAARRLLANRSKFQMAALCLTLIALFLVITGSSPSIVRASIISVLSLLAWYYGRAIPPVSLLLTAGAISVAANPLYIWGNVSWYLSFLAFFGVIVLAPLVTQRLYKGREPPLVMQIIIESICAEALTLPYMLAIFGQMSLVGLLANVLVVAFVPLAMLLCLIAGLAGMFIPALAGWLAWPAQLVLTYMLDTANLLSRIPHSFVEGIGFSAANVAVAYATVALVILILSRRQRQTTRTNRERVI